MDSQMRRNMNALDHRAISFGSSLRSVGIDTGGKLHQVAASSGLGDAIEHRRTTKAVNRAKVKARRKHSRATR